MRAPAPMHDPWPAHATGAIMVRWAFPDDAPALMRLAALDSRVVPAGPMLVAEVGGELWAGLALDGSAIADPFRPTADLVALLATRAGQLSPPAPPRPARGLRALAAALPRSRGAGFSS